MYALTPTLNLGHIFLLAPNLHTYETILLYITDLFLAHLQHLIVYLLFVFCRGYNIGVRLIDEFLAKSNVTRCVDFKETAEVIAKVCL